MLHFTMPASGRQIAVQGNRVQLIFCGETHFQHALPLDRSSMTRWRQRIGPERLEVLLAESLAAAQRGGAVEQKHLGASPSTPPSSPRR